MDKLKNTSFMAGKAGSFSGVPLRTIQSWVERELLIPEIANPKGTGTKRLFSVMNCIEIGIIKSLTDSRVSITMIKKIMKYIRKHTQENMLSRRISPLLIGIEGQETQIFGYLEDDPDPKTSDALGNIIEDLFSLYETHEKVLIVNVQKIADKIKKAIG